MEVSIETVIRDYLALRGESPDLLPVLEEGEDSAVLTLADELKARLPVAAVEATVMTPTQLLGDAVKEVPVTDAWLGWLLETRALPDYLKPYCRTSRGSLLYVPRPSFDGQTLTIGEAAYRRMLLKLAEGG